MGVLVTLAPTAFPSVELLSHTKDNWSMGLDIVIPDPISSGPWRREQMRTSWSIRWGLPVHSMAVCLPWLQIATELELLLWCQQNRITIIKRFTSIFVNIRLGNTAHISLWVTVTVRHDKYSWDRKIDRGESTREGREVLRWEILWEVTLTRKTSSFYRHRQPISAETPNQSDVIKE